jgi:hypothetical protein
LEPLRTALVLVLDDARPALEPVRSEFHAEAAARVIPLHITILFPPHATLPEGVPRETVERRCAALLPLACMWTRSRCSSRRRPTAGATLAGFH